MNLTWEALLHEEKEKAYFKQILKNIKDAQMGGTIIYTESQDIFNAFKLTHF